MYLGRTDADRLLKDNPGDTLQKWGSCQGAVIRPVIQRTRQQDFGVKAWKLCLPTLVMGEHQKRLSDPWMSLHHPPAEWNDRKPFSTLNLMESIASRTFCKLGLAAPIWEQKESTSLHIYGHNDIPRQKHNPTMCIVIKHVISGTFRKTPTTARPSGWPAASPKLGYLVFQCTKWSYEKGQRRTSFKKMLN